MDSEKLAMQRRIDTLDEYATRLHAALTEQEREIARLTAELETVKRERDAAVRDMTFKTRCESCKHYAVDIAAHPCNKCKTTHMGVHDMWEWRGVQENGGIDA